MHTSAIPLVEITLDRVRHLRYDLNALIEVEERTGISLLQSFSPQMLRVKEIRTFLWAGLIHEDPDLTPERVGALVSPGAIGELTQKLHEALTGAMPKSEGEGDAGEEGGTAAPPLPG